MVAWNIDRIASLRRKLAIVTDATSGIGAETALALAESGVQVILAAADAEEGARLLQRIRGAYPLALVDFEMLDLASQDSVQDFSERMAWEHSHIDLLLNHAAPVPSPGRRETEDGFEMHLGAGYLGPFALTLRLLPRLLAAPAPRVVTMTTLAHRRGRIHFDDLQMKRCYRAATAQCQSSLAALIFALELDRLARARGWELMSNAAHPGLTRTGLLQGLPRMLEPFLGQSPSSGALPAVFAATAPQAEGGMLYGPDGICEMRGQPHRAHIPGEARDRDIAARLWDVSERLTGVSVSPFRLAA